MGNICTSDKHDLPFEPLSASYEAAEPKAAPPPASTIAAEKPLQAATDSETPTIGLLAPVQYETSLPSAQAIPQIHVDMQNGGASTSQNNTVLLPSMKRRHSVSAEVLALAVQSQQEALHRKEPDTERLVIKAMSHSFLFTGLEEQQLIDCASSMFRKEVRAGEVLIRQGEEGDNFYVISEGTFQARIAAPGKEERSVCSYEGKGAFGELALMYNCPRAATVQAITEGVVWGMERATFRRIILAARMRQRQHFDHLLQGMAIFDSLSESQRASIADCLELEIFEEGTFVLCEGEGLDDSSKFYILEEGKICCYRSLNGERWLVKEIGTGGFFGEVAFVTKTSVRTADCVASSRCKILTMKRVAFERLMGPTEEVLKKEIEEYQKVNSLLRERVKHVPNS